MTLCMPIFGSQLLPSLVRVGLCTTLSVTVFLPLLHSAHGLGELGIFSLVIQFLKEAFLGFIIGFLASLIFFAYELFGELIDMARAASMAKLLVPELKQSSSPMGTFFFQKALVMTFALGFHRQTITSIHETFITFPINDKAINLVSPHAEAQAIQIFQELFSVATQLALPVIVISFLVDLAFGLMNRIAPQINAYFLSLPAKMVGGLIILFFMVPFLFDDFPRYYRTFAIFLERLNQ